MKKILYITANPKSDEKSYSKRVGHYYIDQIKEKNLDITGLDVYASEIPLIDRDVFLAWDQLAKGVEFNRLTHNQQLKINQMKSILDQFKEADEYIFVTPVWNFSIPPMLKAYIDNIVIAGETFKYSASGPVGLMNGKKATIIQASGSVLSEGKLVNRNHTSKYLDEILRFIGIEDIMHINIEGVAIPGLSEEERLKDVYQKIDQLLA